MWSSTFCSSMDASVDIGLGCTAWPTLSAIFFQWRSRMPG